MCMKHCFRHPHLHCKVLNYASRSWARETVFAAVFSSAHRAACDTIVGPVDDKAGVGRASAIDVDVRDRVAAASHKQLYAVFEEDRRTRRRIQIDVVVIDVDVFRDSVRARRDADTFTCSIYALTMAKACRPIMDSTR